MTARVVGRVRTYVDHRTFGCGYREFIAFNPTKLKVRLLDLGTLKTASVYKRPKRTKKGKVWGLENGATAWYSCCDYGALAKRLRRQCSALAAHAARAEAEGRTPPAFSQEATLAVIKALEEERFETY